ncbi:histidine kinase-like ATPase [Gorgonomyces haynaldii]|nr:histidine kinase-like ATPase [Gorgonomyces haynaldii]
MQKHDHSTERKIQATQIVVSPFSVVKELVENALDAQATNIQVMIKDGGLESIQIVDNGTGIMSLDIQKMLEQGATSKIKNFESLDECKTFGFRGEALGAIASLSSLTLATRTHDEPIGRVYESVSNKFESRGTKVMQVGTTITVQKLMEQFPVRRQAWRKDIARIQQQIRQWMSAIGMIFFDVRLSLKMDQMWIKPRFPNRGACIANDAGPMVYPLLSSHYDEWSSESEVLSISVFCPKSLMTPLCWYSSADHVHVAINQRPVSISKDEIAKSVLQMVRHPSTRKYPFLWLQIQMPPSLVDANLEPDKSSLHTPLMDEIVQRLNQLFSKLFNKDMCQVDPLLEVSDPQSQSVVNLPSAGSTLSVIKSESTLALNKSGSTPSAKGIAGGVKNTNPEKIIDSTAKKTTETSTKSNRETKEVDREKKNKKRKQETTSLLPEAKKASRDYLDARISLRPMISQDLEISRLSMHTRSIAASQKVGKLGDLLFQRQGQILFCKSIKLSTEWQQIGQLT